MKIYTKKGDKGDTSLYGGERVSKSSSRIRAYGSVDELNSIIGLALSYSLSDRGASDLGKIQEHLLILGADLATPPGSETRIDRIGEDEVKFLEKKIDTMDEYLPTLKNFILPGGSQPGATLHVARTVCRRAERAVVECSKEEEISVLAIKYLNRLSDFLFVAARYENRHAGVLETKWKPGKKSGDQ